MKHRWWHLDSLPVRLFVVLWLALVLAHYLGYGLQVLGAAGHAHPPMPPTPPPVMALPPADGLPPPGARVAPPGAPAPPGAAGAMALHEPPGPPGSAGWAVLTDYGARLLVFALAAALAARWVARPLSRLHESASQLERQVLSGEQPVPVPEHDGPREVREVAAAYNRMSQRLVQQFEERAMMMASVSHDLRTPLTRMRLRLEQPDSPERQQAMLADLARMDSLIEQVLVTVRAERHAAPPVALALEAFVRACVDDHAEAGRAVHWRASASAITDHVVVQVDPHALQRVLDNLIDNALRHGQIAWVGLDSGPAGELQLRIDDEGPGIAEADLERVMQPFVRLDQARGLTTGGAGLGLYIARQLAVRQGITLTLSNRPEGGLRACLTWSDTTFWGRSSRG